MKRFTSVKFDISCVAEYLYFTISIFGSLWPTCFYDSEMSPDL